MRHFFALALCVLPLLAAACRASPAPTPTSFSLTVTAVPTEMPMPLMLPTPTPTLFVPQWLPTQMPEPTATVTPVTTPTREASLTIPLNTPQPFAPGLACGAERWSVKTVSDPDSSLVHDTIQRASVTELRALVPPSHLPADSRVAPTEMTIYQVRARVQDFKREDDRDIHVVIANPDNPNETMIAEAVDTTCSGATGSVYRNAMAQARDAFVAICGSPTRSFKSCGAEVEITGIGFFDFIHGQRGVAPNGIELHPVLAVKVLSVQTSPTFTPTIPPSISQLVPPASTAIPTLKIGRRTGQPLRYDPLGPDRDCVNFASWAEAQDFFEAAAGPSKDLHRLDADHDGIACESLPGSPRSSSVSSFQTPLATVPVTPTSASRPSGSTALCRDGTFSYSRTRSGTCSHHGGVAQWY